MKFRFTCNENNVFSFDIEDYKSVGDLVDDIIAEKADWITDNENGTSIQVNSIIAIEEVRETHIELPHAEWQNGKCTNCGSSAISADGKRRGDKVFYTPHCPYCGAIMDNNLFNAVHGAKVDGGE